ncbi:MAG: hypothetical protein ABJF10_06795 [Chthoniobacter sp.]|uniref:hypothetical protein n=1 Tax=Chthoniobacter sp. TaxID=2510640 RepID=UPI0032A3DF58
MNRPLSKLLDDEIQRLATDPKFSGNLGTLQEQADFLGTTKSWLSRLRNGKVSLSNVLAQQFAARLRPESGPECAHLYQELRKFGEPETTQHEPTLQSLEDTGDIRNVEGFFDRVGRLDTLVCVDYRDVPRADPAGKYRSYAVLAGQAIAAGGSFAMFQPFGSDDHKREANGTGELKSYYHTQNVRAYLGNLIRRVRHAYELILAEALKTANEMGVRPEEVAKRIVLYERGDLAIYPPNFTTGVLSRLFYAEVPNKETFEREVWEWVASPRRDFFIRRDESSAPVDVISEQFVPVVSFWQDNHRLPLTDEELASNMQTACKELYAQLPAQIWVVSEVTKQARAAIEN